MTGIPGAGDGKETISRLGQVTEIIASLPCVRLTCNDKIDRSSSHHTPAFVVIFRARPMGLPFYLDLSLRFFRLKFFRV